MLPRCFSQQHIRIKLLQMCREKSFYVIFYRNPHTHPTIVLLCNKNNPLISAQTNGSSLPAAGSLVVEVCSNCKSLPKKAGMPTSSHKRGRQGRPGNGMDKSHQSPVKSPNLLPPPPSPRLTTHQNLDRISCQRSGTPKPLCGSLSVLLTSQLWLGSQLGEAGEKG